MKLPSATYMIPALLNLFPLILSLNIPTKRAIGDITEWNCKTAAPLITPPEIQKDLHDSFQETPEGVTPCYSDLGPVPSENGCSISFKDAAHNPTGAGFCINKEGCRKDVTNREERIYLQNFLNVCGGGGFHDGAVTRILDMTGQPCGQIGVFQNISDAALCGKPDWGEISKPDPPGQGGDDGSGMIESLLEIANAEEPDGEAED